MQFHHRDVIAINDFTRQELLHVLQHASNLKRKKRANLLNGSLLGSCFFEPSTRTRLSFESAMHRLGGNVIGFSESSSISTKKGESLYDSMKMIENYADIAVIRHPLEGAAQYAADSISIPVINAGDGSNQHPTQTLLDLFTIQECQGTLDQLHIGMAGDLKYGRTVHSLTQALIHFHPRLYFISQSSLEIPKEICDLLKEQGIKFSFHQTIEEVISKLDILYMTRIQEERFPHQIEFERVKNSYILKTDHLKKVKESFKIFHPLPRVNEIDRNVDDTPYAHYFEQAKNGLYVRQALLGLLLGALK